MASISFSDSGLYLSSASTTGSFTYTCSDDVNSSSVQGSSSTSWLVINTVSNGTASYTATANSTTATRASIVTLSAVDYSGNSVSNYLVVYQYGGDSDSDGTITVSSTYVLVQAAGGSSTFSFSTDGIDTSTITVTSDSSWVTINSVTSSAFTYSWTTNSTSDSRGAYVTIQGKNSSNTNYVSRTLTFSQPAASTVGTIDASTSSIILTSGSTTGYAYFTGTNISSITSVEYADSWLSGTSLTYSDGSGTIAYSVESNSSTASRTTYATIYGVSSIDGSEVTGIQYWVQMGASSATTTGSISLTNQTIAYDYLEQSGTSYYSTTNMDDSSIYLGAIGGNFTEDGQPSVNLTAKTVTWTVAENESSASTSSYFTLCGYDTDGNLRSVKATITQLGSPETTEFPIWQDTTLTVSSNTTYVDYILTTSGDTRYAGRAYMGSSGSCDILLNEICENFLRPAIDLETEGLQDNNEYCNALMKISYDDGENYTTFQKVKCYADWSYEEFSDDDARIISNPISYTLDSRQLLLFSVIDLADSYPTVIFTQEQSDGSSTFSTYSLRNNIGTIVRSVASASEVTIDVNSLSATYTVEEGCRRYCLYYLNSYGGFDSFLFENTSKETDSFVRNRFKKKVLNTLCKHQDCEYLNQITKGWTLKTRYLTDEQSLNFAKNLIPSTLCYLHDLEDDVIYPVNITSSSSEYKTFVRNGRKLCRYDINVELARERKRR